MKNNADVFRQPTSVLLVSKMHRSMWKEILLAAFVLLVVAVPVMITVVLDHGLGRSPMLWPAIGVFLALVMWPGRLLFWNVLGEEYFEVSPTAMKWGYNYGLLKIHAKPYPATAIRLQYRPGKTIAGEQQGGIDFWTTNQHGFQVLVRSTAIPIPQSTALAMVQQVQDLYAS